MSDINHLASLEWVDDEAGIKVTLHTGGLESAPPAEAEMTADEVTWAQSTASGKFIWPPDKDPDA